MTRKEINELNVVEPYCIETDREEQWFNVGLKAGLDVGEKYIIDKACEWLREQKEMIGISFEEDFIGRFKKRNGGMIMTKEEKRKLYEPKCWNLYVNGIFINSFPSHSAAKKAKYFKEKEAKCDWLDLNYEIKQVDSICGNHSLAEI